MMALCIGATAGCIYGMVKVDSDLVNQGIATVDGVKGYIEGVIGVVDTGVHAANAIDASLLNIQTIIEQDVNVTCE